MPWVRVSKLSESIHFIYIYNSSYRTLKFSKISRDSFSYLVPFKSFPSYKQANVKVKMAWVNGIGNFINSIYNILKFKK